MLQKLVILGMSFVGGIAIWETGKLQHSMSHPGIDTQIQAESDPAIRSIKEPEQETRITTGQSLITLALFILLAPVITAPLANRILDRHSNTANLLLLFSYTGLDILAAHMVGNISIGGILSAIVYLAALLAVFSYNLWICAFLARLRR